MRFILFIAITVLPLVTFGQIPFSLQDRAFLESTSPLRKDLVGYWSFEELTGTRYDRSKNGNHFTANSGPGQATGKINFGTTLTNTAQQFFSIADNSTFPSGSTPLTVSVWVNLRSKGGAGDQRSIVAQYDHGNNNRAWALVYDQATDRFQWFVSSAGTSGSAISVSATSFGSPSLNTWYHILAYFDPANSRIGICVNNGTHNTTSATTLFNSAAALTVGSLQNNGAVSAATSCYDGLIDELGIWRRILTPKEHNILYNQTFGNNFPAYRGGDPYTIVWRSNVDKTDGTMINTYRIPSITRTSTGRLLAFCESRALSAADNGTISVIRKYSDDGGVSWNNFATNTVAAWASSVQYFITTSMTNGSRVWVFYVSHVSTATEAQITAGTAAACKVYRNYSDDDGASFTNQLEITSSVMPAGGRFFGTGPGSGIITASGRMVVPFRYSDATTTNFAGIFYSDDDGTTWATGGIVAESSYEASVVELPNGNLRLNCRRVPGSPTTNRLCFDSSDDGATWGAGFADTALIDPNVEGSIVRMPDSTIVFANPASTTTRTALKLRKSTDSAAPPTWTSGLQISTGAEPAAYSSLVPLSASAVGCLWEGGGGALYTEILFRVLQLSDL